MEHQNTGRSAAIGITAVKILAALLAFALVSAMLAAMVLWVGTPLQTETAEAGSFGIDQKYSMFVTNQTSDALDGILSVKKQYWIGKDALTAPRPNPDKYGETDDPATLQWLLDEAAELLDGQTLYFTTETKIMPGTKVRYYLDDTILAITWKQVIGYGGYTFSEIKIAHPSQFRRFLANNEFGSDKLFITTEMAASVNAVVASSGDFYRFRKAGTLVYDGAVRRVTNGLVDTCYIDENGDMLFSRSWEYKSLEESQDFVDQNHVNFSLAFGPLLIRDGQNLVPEKYSVGEINDEYPRAALCQMGKLHYLLATVNHDGMYQHVPKIADFANVLKTTNCIHAYALDGGQTAVIAMNDQIINSVLFGFQRKISDIIYFATAIPNH